MGILLSRTGLRNLVALIGIQGSNALVPLIIVPFALAMIGTEAYAQVAITEALSSLALAMVLFSFDVDGVARIAKLEKPARPEALSEALSAVVAARLLLFVVVSPLLLAGYLLSGGQNADLLALWLLVPLGQVFHSYWFYQAIEDNVVPAAITLLSRGTTIATVVLFVRDASDAAWIPLAVGGPFAIGGMISLLYLRFGMRITVRRVNFTTIASDLLNGKEIFAGNVAVTLYREMNVVILGVVGVPAAGVATYALVEKSIKMLQACTRPLNQLFFPKVLRDLRNASSPDRRAIRRISRYTLPQAAVVVAMMVSLPILYLLASALFPTLKELAALPDVVLMASIMAPAMLLGLANFMFGTAGLNTLNQRGYYFRAILLTGVLSVGICFLLAWRFGAVGAAWCFLFSEGLLFLLVFARYLISPKTK